MKKYIAGVYLNDTQIKHLAYYTQCDLRPDWSELSRTGSQRELTRTDSEHVQNCELSCKPVRASCKTITCRRTELN
jgi:hypothetical protein